MCRHRTGGYLQLSSPRQLFTSSGVFSPSLLSLASHYDSQRFEQTNRWLSAQCLWYFSQLCASSGIFMPCFLRVSAGSSDVLNDLFSRLKGFRLYTVFCLFLTVNKSWKIKISQNMSVFPTSYLLYSICLFWSTYLYNVVTITVGRLFFY